MIISRISTTAQRPVCPSFRRKLREDEVKGIVTENPKSIAQTCDLIGQGVINVKDGALNQVQELTRQYRCCVWLDAVRHLLENK